MKVKEGDKKRKMIVFVIFTNCGYLFESVFEKNKLKALCYTYNINIF